MNNTSIQWTDTTWNPVRGCSRVSEGCRNCYAEKMAARFSDVGMPYEGLAVRNPARWTGKVRLIEEHLEDPLKWKKPRRIFVNSMSDLFHESLTIEQVAAVFQVMHAASWHTFQVLTKRPQRMMEFCKALVTAGGPNGILWPFPNVHMGVSVEDAKTYKERVRFLAMTRAAVRFLSIEPLLEDIGDMMLDGIFAGAFDWVIVGGESGPDARPLDLDALRSVVAQCKYEPASVPVYVKQDSGKRPGLQGRIPNELWLKEFPTAKTTAEVAA